MSEPFDQNANSFHTTVRQCPWFPDIECDDICEHLGCGAQGLLIKMKSEGVPQAEIGGSPDFRPTNEKGQQ